MSIVEVRGGPITVRHLEKKRRDTLARELMDAYRQLWHCTEARPREEWTIAEGFVLWWRFPVSEPPYLGTPLDSEWPGYHTHFTRLPVPFNPGE